MTIIERFTIMKVPPRADSDKVDYRHDAKGSYKAYEIQGDILNKERNEFWSSSLHIKIGTYWNALMNSKTDGN